MVRHSAATPRKHCFSGYLDDAAATEVAWRGGWFHTGDIVTRAADGLLRFVDRRKNIIRRSGENIAAAEVEAVLQTHPLVEQAAVLAVPDDLREEEVLACVVLKDRRPADAAAPPGRRCSTYCNANLAYFKTPGWVWLTDSIPPRRHRRSRSTRSSSRAWTRGAGLAFRYERPAHAQAPRSPPSKAETLPCHPVPQRTCACRSSARRCSWCRSRRWSRHSARPGLSAPSRTSTRALRAVRAAG